MTTTAWWRDFHLDGHVVQVRKTGARIPIDGGIVSECVAWLGYHARIELARRSVPSDGPRVWFTPDRPRPWYLVWSVLHAAGARIADSPETADAVFVFDDCTVCHPVQAQPGTRLINAGCQSIAKSHVARVFEQCFGYPLSVDPESWAGPMVEKSEINGAHDGRIIQGPAPARHGHVYQRVIDNRNGRGLVEDLRCPTIGGEIPLVLYKRRRIETRFCNSNDEVEIAETEDVLSAEEVAQLGRFARAMKLDWGGLDVLRDRSDGRLYVVDVNKKKPAGN